MLSIGRHVDFDARASKILTPPSQCENPYFFNVLQSLLQFAAAQLQEQEWIAGKEDGCVLFLE